MNVGEHLLILWATYWLSAALVGAFIGTSLALGLGALIRRIRRKK